MLSMEEASSIQLLVQAGAVGLAFFLIWVVYKMATNHTKHIEASTERFTQAMDRNTDAWVKNAETSARLLERLSK